MTDDELAAELRRALHGVRVGYDAAGADAMIANATDAPLRPEQRAWAAPVAAAAAVVVIGGGAALIAAGGDGHDGSGAPAGGCADGSSPGARPPDSSASVGRVPPATPTFTPTATFPGTAVSSHLAPQPTPAVPTPSYSVAPATGLPSSSDVPAPCAPTESPTLRTTVIVPAPVPPSLDKLGRTPPSRCTVTVDPHNGRVSVGDCPAPVRIRPAVRGSCIAVVVNGRTTQSVACVARPTNRPTR